MSVVFENHAPFALSLSKGLPSSGEQEKGKGFDKLSPNGFVETSYV